MSFQITALPRDLFAPLLALPDDALPARARRVVAQPGETLPCRVSLADADPGDTLLLLHHEHQPADTPFRAGHAIYVREQAEQAHPAAGEIPAVLRSRLLSLRAFDANGMMRDADIAPGAELEPAIARLLADPAVAYLHLHFAKPGCYAARVDRA
jgi:hypothetical protein